MIKFPILNNQDGQHKDLLELIPEGEKNAIPLNELADKLHIDLLQLLRKIEYAQLEGNVIAVMNIGAFIPGSETELQSYVNYEKARIQFEIEALNTAHKLLYSERLVMVYEGVDYEE